MTKGTSEFKTQNIIKQLCQLPIKPTREHIIEVLETYRNQRITPEISNQIASEILGEEGGDE